MNKKSLAILTPSYNRGYILPQLYESLNKQSVFDFKWYIIDDGSSDDTKKVVSTFQTDKFEISYIYKENGGKHTALNVGLEHIKEELTFIVDSDDFLTEDAVETIVNDWGKYKNREENICGLSYYRLKLDGSVIGDSFSNKVLIDTFINVRVNNKIKGDKAEIYLTSVLKQFPFPSFPDERFLSEAIVWNAISNAGYKLVFLDKGIYYCEYLADGLSVNSRKLQLTNAKGTLLHAKAHFYKSVKTGIRLKYMLMYISVIKFVNKKYSEAFMDLNSGKILYVLVFLPAWLLAIYWKRKYKL